MYAKKIASTNYNTGEKKERTYYFNLTKAEIIKMELSEDGGLDKRLNRLIQTQDMKEAIKVFEALILMAYGIKTDDGRFVKTEEARNKFVSSAAYSEIYMDLATNPEEAQKFVEGVVPKIDQSSIPAPAITDKH